MPLGPDHTIALEVPPESDSERKGTQMPYSCCRCRRGPCRVPRRMLLKYAVICLLAVMFCLPVTAATNEGAESFVTGLVGDSVDLPCNVDVDNCGDVYFITWTKNVTHEWKRLYLFSDAVEKPLQELANPDRADFFLKDSSAFLRISPLRLEDEGNYKCDVTYVQGKCPSLSYANLVTLAKPGLPIIEREGVEVRSGSTVGPFFEGTGLSLDCKSTGGKPTPDIYWWNGSESLESEKTVIIDDHGTSNVSTTFTIILTREDLGKRIECRVQNNATIEPLVSWVKPDLHVKPSSLHISGPAQPVIEDDVVILTCVIDGAKPAANATWYNRSEVIQDQPSAHAEMTENGTFRTVSQLEIIASRYDHHGVFYCKGTNPVLHSFGDPPMLKSIDLLVFYRPEVAIQPAGGILANESDGFMIFCTFTSNPPDVEGVVWYKDREVIDVAADPRMASSNPGYPTLTIRNITRHDHGQYACSVKNMVGMGNSTKTVEVNVLYAPTVEARVSPSAVSEDEPNSVSLVCEILDGNPQNLLHVRWYKDGELLNETSEKEIGWLNVSRNFTGNYSCTGENAAGWGDMSDTEEFVVHYLPGPATIIQVAGDEVKGHRVSFECVVEDPGCPIATAYRWEHDGDMLSTTEDNYTTEPIQLRDRGNYSCAAVNEVGLGGRGYYHLTPLAPPAIVDGLPPFHGAAENDDSISVTCRIECDPMCEVFWLKDGEPIDENDPYIIKTTVHPEEADKNLFTSVVSTLYWNMSAWPGGSLDREHDNANYTCLSNGNVVEATGVSSTTFFQVEFPPEDISVSPTELEVMEYEIPEVITCTARCWPPCEFFWRFTDLIIYNQPELFLNHKITREQAGTYICVAGNKHGQISAASELNILYKPKCKVYESRNEDDETTIVCESDANPASVNFTWSRTNTSVDEELIESAGTRSILTLPSSDPIYYGMYYCKANNSLGSCVPDYIEVTGVVGAAGLVPGFSDENIIILAAVVGGVAIVFIIVIILMIIVMRRRRSRNINSPSKPIPSGGGDPLYQNVAEAGKKENGPPVTEAENKAMYENMPFHQPRGQPKGVSDES